MKTKQIKIDRSAAKWLRGAMALAATTASSQAATVQITLTGNKISATGGNQLVADLTGDTISDVALVEATAGSTGAFVKINGLWVFAIGAPGRNFSVVARFGLGGVGTSYRRSVGPTNASYLNPITFTDHRINNNNPTGGWLQVNAFNTSLTSHTVELARLIFDDANTARPSFSAIPDVQPTWVAAVPEPGSNLALLALGAGGLTLRRRLKRMA